MEPNPQHTPMNIGSNALQYIFISRIQEYLNKVFDTWIQAGCKPIIETDFMPDALAAGTIVRNYSGGAINPPKDYNKWRDLIYQTVQHCIERYGRDEVRTWYWEIWNEPDLTTYFGGTLNDLVKMYDYFVDGAVAADSLVKVGGPGIAGNETFFRGFLNHCVNETNYVTGKKGTRIDFVSWHEYGVFSYFVTKNRKMSSIVMNEFPSLSQCELQQNEWGQSLNPNPITTLTNYEARFLVKCIDALYSDSTIRIHKFLRWGQPASFNQVETGWRTLMQVPKGEVIPFSILNAYEMLGKLGSERIAFSGTRFGDAVHGLATRSNNSIDSANAVHALVYHFVESNQTGEGDSLPVNLTVRGLENRREVRLAHYRIDKYHSDAYNAWLAMGSPQTPTDAQIQQLKKAAALQLFEAPSIIPVQNNEVNLSFKLPINSVSLFVLSDSNPTNVSNDFDSPSGYALYQNYPNPFPPGRGSSRSYGNPSTTIRFSLPQRGHVEIKVFDVLGREVESLVDEELIAGEHSVIFDALNLSRSMYFYHMSVSQTENIPTPTQPREANSVISQREIFRETKKLIIAK